MTKLENTLDHLKKAYNTCYQSLIYIIGFSSAAGLGNGLTEISKGDSFSDGFGQGYVNHLPLVFLAGYVYTEALKFFKKTNHYRLYTNLFQTAIPAIFLTWHYLVGTDNPIQTVIPAATIGFMMVNNQVSKDSLENKLNHQP